jgi:hypothetical protein
MLFLLGYDLHLLSHESAFNDPKDKISAEARVTWADYCCYLDTTLDDLNRRWSQ